MVTVQAQHRRQQGRTRSAGAQESADPLRDSATYDDPKLQCDIVMKGGITSGVVYPRGVCEVARDYRFRSIGGTSAGAVAAAAAAAAELGRSRGTPGFPELAALPEWCGAASPTRGRSNLFALFQPQRSTEPLFRALVAAAGRGSWYGRALRFLLAAGRSFPVSALVGALPGAGLVALALWAADGWVAAAFTVVGLVVACAGAGLCVAVALASRMGRTLPANYYGMCLGLANGRTDAAALTPWLSSLLDRLAGQQPGQPLTFGDLWRGPEPDPDHGIDLRLMTTSLTHGRPYRVPFDGEELFFDPDEFRRLFPEYVVRWMVDHSKPRVGPTGPGGVPADLRTVPQAADLPVVVGARLSLSFPLLVSAVPLWAVDKMRDGENAGVPERAWFSDGGISSNFPVHFFDSPLPGRPTFAINLRPFHVDRPRSEEEEENSWVIPDIHGGADDWWYRFDAKGGLRSFLGFVGAIGGAMQNWVDNGQLKVPGYRDRVVHVFLETDEGGLNLDMPVDLIKKLAERGRHAAGKLARRYGPDGDGSNLTWDNHRWVRYRSTMAVLEDILRRMRSRYTGGSAGRLSYPDMIRRGDADPPDSYRWESAMRERAERLTEELMRLELLADGDPVFHSGAPEPVPELRIVPKI
ncbi:MAG: SuhR protein [Gemmatimonadota bacterium]